MRLWSQVDWHPACHQLGVSGAIEMLATYLLTNLPGPVPYSDAANLPGPVEYSVHVYQTR